MLPRTFNSIMNSVNKLWAANVLNMNVNYNSGADLLDEEKLVEVKFFVKYSFKYTHASWKVLGHLLNYCKDNRNAFWGLGFYTMKKEIAEIKTKVSTRLESLVERREIFIVSWKWMYQFPQYHQKGKTKISKWDHYILFPKARLLRNTEATYSVHKGLVHITEGVPLEIFLFSDY